MQEIKSQLNARSAEFKANADAMRGLVEDLREKVANTALGGGESARAKHTARGKLLPRERIEQPDATVEKGTQLLVMEAMKMEHTISAPRNGVVKEFCCTPGDQVSDGAELLVFEGAD